MLRLEPSVYDKAADLIAVQGHAKGVYKNADGCYCTIGAIIAARGGVFESDGVTIVPYTVPPDWVDYTAHLNGYLSATEETSRSVPSWNDRPERTQGEAVAVLRGCAQNLRTEYEARRRHEV